MHRGYGAVGLAASAWRSNRAEKAQTAVVILAFWMLCAAFVLLAVYFLYLGPVDVSYLYVTIVYVVIVCAGLVFFLALSRVLAKRRAASAI